VRFRLFDYQEVAADAIVRALRRAARDFAEDHEYTAINLTAPTAAGKTVMATAAIERLFEGDDFGPGDPEATVLWVTDDPSLNEQTRRKMDMSSTALGSRLVTIDAAFDQETFDPGRVYFLNIQKLGKSTGYVKGGVDKRTYSLWTTLRRTVEERGGHFVVVIDEAHRGARSNRERPTIVGRIISDPDGAVPPMPIVWGISATPERFEEAISRTGRTMKPVRVPIEEVRESGLIKDKVLIKHKAEAQPGDATLGYLAVEELRRFDAGWGTYADDEDEPRVRPVLAVQVKAKASDNELADLLAALRDGWEELAGDAIAHTFESHAPLNIKGQVVRYIAPQDIEDDPDARVVLFKEALTTGWDCPRAEVMLSYRKAEDYTYIAQLIGRMVRTPLAKRVMTDDVLNSVSLYLPYFDEESVLSVIERLRKDPDAPPTTIERNPVECSRNPAVPAAVVERLKALPTYIVPGRAHRSQVSRLHMLAARLAGDDIAEDAIEVADRHLIDTLDRERNRLAADGTLDRLVNALAVIDYGVIEVSLVDDDIKAAVQSATTHVRNIDDLLKAAGRGLRDGLAKTYWAHLIDGGEEPSRAKLITSALASDPAVVAAVEAAAEERVQAWLKEHSRAISGLSEARKTPYYAVRQQARDSEQFDLVLPTKMTASADDPTWERHLYSDGAGKFHAKFTGWEEDVLRAELNPDQGLVGWYRNPTGGERAIRVPYATTEGYDRPMYPDFIFFHEDGSEIVVSIVDPHNYALADAGPKWRGLGAYAERHGDAYGRIDAVIKDPEGALLRLDLKDPTARDALDGCHDKDDILKAFREHGGAYT
jgi:type III restriction enzyme